MRATLIVRVIFLVCTSLACMPLAGRTAENTEAAALRALNATARGGPVPSSYRQIITFSGTTGSGKTEIFHRGADERESVDEGSLHTESGTSGRQDWHENENGHVVIDDPDPGLATPENFITTVAHVTTPIAADVIATLNAKGFGSRDFYDPVSHLLVRVEVLRPNGKIVTTYDDFKTFGARRVAAHWHVDDATSATQDDYVMQQYAAGDVAETDVAIPSIKRAIVEYPAGVDRVVLPAQFLPGGHVVVRLTIAGRGFDFILDTGASTITLDPAVAKQLGLTVFAKQKSSVNAGRFDTGRAIVPRIAVGSLIMRDTVVSITPMGWQEANVKLVGLLGFDFLCESGITIDYDHQTVTAERFGTYAQPQAARTIVLTARLGSQIPMTTVKVNGAIAERMMVDTGGTGPFIIFDYFARRYPEALPAANRFPAVNLNGAGGSFEARRTQLNSVVIGNVTFNNFTGYVVASRASYSSANDGIVGPDFLRFFDVHLDYPNGAIYLVPNATGQKAMH